MVYRCLIADDERPARELIESYANQLTQLEVVSTCKDGLQALNALRENEYHILFLDIQMPHLKGTELVPMIQGKLPVVIFTTAYDQYALDAFDLDAVDYLLKPFGFDRFVKAVDKAIERVSALTNQAASGEPSFMMVKSEHKLVRINIDDIVYIEALREYVRIFTKDMNVMTLDTMKNMESRLPAEKFSRIHKSYIVALNKIGSLQGNQVEIQNKKLPIGRSFKNALMAALKMNGGDGLQKDE